MISQIIDLSSWDSLYKSAEKDGQWPDMSFSSTDVIHDSSNGH
jgi:hypothetical protein